MQITNYPLLLAATIENICLKTKKPIDFFLLLRIAASVLYPMHPKYSWPTSSGSKIN